MSHISFKNFSNRKFYSNNTCYILNCLSYIFKIHPFFLRNNAIIFKIIFPPAVIGIPNKKIFFKLIFLFFLKICNATFDKSPNTTTYEKRRVLKLKTLHLLPKWASVWCGNINSLLFCKKYFEIKFFHSFKSRKVHTAVSAHQLFTFLHQSYSKTNTKALCL